MLHLISLFQCQRCTQRALPLLTNSHFRYLCCGCGKKGCDCKPGCGCDKSSDNGKNDKEDGCEKKTDLTEIRGGGQKKCKGEKKEDEEENICEKLILEREAKKEKSKGECEEKSSEKQRCPPTPCPQMGESPHQQATKWKRITLFCALPMIALLTALVFTSHHEEERPEFRKWPHMYKREKPFYFGDGIRSFYHNKHLNAIPEGYEDEIDVEANGKAPETEKEKEDRLKEFNAVHKVWKKHDSNREASAKKAQAAAEKEAKRQEKEAEKEAKKQQAEEAKELKRQQAEIAKEEKRLKAEAEKERKREEAEQKKQAKQVENAIKEGENEKEKS